MKKNKLTEGVQKYIDENPEMLKEVVFPELIQELIQELKNMVPIDRFGSCPSCGSNWDGGDIYEAISNLDINMGKSPESILKLVELNYGYNLVNKKRFTKLVGVTFEKGNTSPLPDYYKCPYCGNMWNSVTHEHFNSIKELKEKLNEQSV